MEERELRERESWTYLIVKQVCVCSCPHTSIPVPEGACWGPGSIQTPVKVLAGDGLAPEYQCNCWKITANSWECQGQGSHMQIGIIKIRKWRVLIFLKTEGFIKNSCLPSNRILSFSHVKAWGSTVTVDLASVAGRPGFESWIWHVILGNAFHLPVR